MIQADFDGCDVTTVEGLRIEGPGDLVCQVADRLRGMGYETNVEWVALTPDGVRRCIVALRSRP